MVTRRELKQEMRNIQTTIVALRWQLIATIMGTNALVAIVSPVVAAAMTGSIALGILLKVGIAAILRG